MIFSFETEPQPGTMIWLDEQAFELAGVVDYTRADGTEARLCRWFSSCPDCGGSFEQLSPMAAGSLIRRCSEHRRPGRPVKGKRGRRLKVRIEEP